MPTQPEARPSAVDDYFHRLSSLARADAHPTAMRNLAVAMSGLTRESFAAAGNTALATDLSKVDGNTAVEDLEALMEHLGHLAVGTRYEAEAGALAGALVPLVLRKLPSSSDRARSLPPLVRATAAAVRGLRQDSATRPLVRLLPAILRGAAERAGGTGNGVRPDLGEALAAELTRILADPALCVDTYARSRAADERFHCATRGQ